VLLDLNYEEDSEPNGYECGDDRQREVCRDPRYRRRGRFYKKEMDMLTRKPKKGIKELTRIQKRVIEHNQV